MKVLHLNNPVASTITIHYATTKKYILVPPSTTVCPYFQGKIDGSRESILNSSIMYFFSPFEVSFFSKLSSFHFKVKGFFVKGKIFKGLRHHYKAIFLLKIV